MTPKTEYLIDLIFKKLKNYNSKKILLEKENLKKFIFSLFKENWVKRKHFENCYSKKKCEDINMYNFSSLTIFLIIAFILSLYFLYKVTSNAKN